MLANSKLLVDKNCPMCTLYGNCFIDLKLLDKDSLSPYQSSPVEITQWVNMDKAKSEIALLDTESGTTLYGVDAILKILTHDRKWLNLTLNNKLVKNILQPIYAFISYNRKVIAPSIVAPHERPCDPGINLPLRWTYIILVALFTAIILNSYTATLLGNLGFTPLSPFTELFVCLAQIVWQGTAILYIKKEKTLDYLGNMSTVSLIGGLLLIPFLFLSNLIFVHPMILLLVFITVVSFMLWEHLRRCKLLDIPLDMTISWVGFRITVLLIITLFL